MFGSVAQGGMKVMPPESRGGCLRQLAWVVAAMATALLVTGFFAARSEGGREMLEQQLGKRMGLTVTIGEVGIGWPYALVARNIRSQEKTPLEEPVLECKEARVALDGLIRWRVDMAGLRLNLRRTGEGVLVPAGCEAIEGLPSQHISAVSRVGGLERRKYSVHVEDASVRWLDASGQAQFAAERMSFDLWQVRLATRRMCHYRLRVGQWTGAAGELREVEREWLATDTADYLLLQSAQRPPAVADDAFWADEPAAGAPDPAAAAQGPAAGATEGEVRGAGEARDPAPAEEELK